MVQKSRQGYLANTTHLLELQQNIQATCFSIFLNPSIGQEQNTKHVQKKINYRKVFTGHEQVSDLNPSIH
jgi:hypothetical protein